jgi:hypothetical protein
MRIISPGIVPWRSGPGCHVRLALGLCFRQGSENLVERVGKLLSAPPRDNHGPRVWRNRRYVKHINSHHGVIGVLLILSQKFKVTCFYWGRWHAVAKRATSIYQHFSKWEVLCISIRSSKCATVIRQRSQTYSYSAAAIELHDRFHVGLRRSAAKHSMVRLQKTRTHA